MIRKWGDRDMLIPRAIIAPLVGGVIGYITNDLAIRMLFRPRKAVYIGKFHVPFTPGLIPGQQNRIAQSIGDVVSKQLLNEETLRQTLLSEGTVETLRKKALTALRILSKDERKVSDLFRQPFIREKLDMSVEAYQQKLTDDLYARYQDKEEALIDGLTELYTSILGSNLGKLLEAINIERIVVDKINALDAAELEGVIFGIMKRELKAIVYLGALLGFLMGFVNLLL